MPPADRPLPDFQPHDPRTPHSEIEREIERSERASAALAAARALARASFTDSQLAAEDAAGDPDFHPSGWVRTEYAALDHSARRDDDAAREATPRNLLGGTFNPGIASQHGRAFPGVSIPHTPIKTRTGAQARFLQESRQTPRPERPPGAAARSEPAIAGAAAHYDKPAVIPMLAPAMAPVAAATPARARTPAGEPVKFLMAAGLGAAVVLMAGGVALKAGLLSPPSPNPAATVTGRITPQAEATPVLSPSPQEIVIAPAAGVMAPRSDAETNAALAAAARAAAVPTASVRAAGPVRVARPLSGVTAPVAAVPAVPTAPAQGKQGVAAAIANAQARADRFLATGNGSSPTASATTASKQDQ